ncbi:MAG: hypothetical protein ABIY90_15135 [Puia sp.]
MPKKEYYTVLLIILGSLCLSFLNCPLFELFFDDKAIFEYIGQVIYKGGVPYRDVFDHKPPLIYFLNALNWAGNAWVPWLINSLLVLLASLLFYDLCKKARLAWPWFLPLFFNLLIRNSLVSLGGGMTREYTAIFMLLFFCIMLGSLKYKHFVLGLLSGLTFWMQQDAIITLVPFLIYGLFSASGEMKDRRLIKKTAALCCGFISISLPVIIYFQMHQALSWLWKDAFYFNLRLPYRQMSFVEKIRTIKHALHETEYEMGFYTSLILGVGSLFLTHKKRNLLYTALLGLALSFIAEFLTGRMSPGRGFSYYLLPLASSLPILVFVVFAYSEALFLKDRYAQLLINCMLCLTLFLGTIRFASGIQPSGNNLGRDNGSVEMEYLKSQSLSDYQLYIFYDPNLIYFYNTLRILSPSPWIYHYFWEWFRDWDNDNGRMRSILNDLQLHKTTFIIDCSDAKGNLKNKPAYALWKGFLRGNYRPVLTDGSNRILWRIQ